MAVHQSHNQKKNMSLIIQKVLRYIYLLASVCGGHQPDLSLPLLLGGSVNGFDQQWSFREHRMLIALGSINYSISLYHKVRRVTAFKMHQTTSSTVSKPHCKRQRKIDLSLEKEKKTVQGETMEITDVEKTDKQTDGPQRFYDSPSTSYIIHFKLYPEGIALNRCS